MKFLYLPFIALSLIAGSAAAQQWTFSALDPADPPYLSGGAAGVLSEDGDTRLVYSCTEEGGTIMLDGRIPQNLPMTVSVLFMVDSGPPMRLTLDEYEGARIAPVRGQRAILASIQGGSRLNIHLDGMRTPFASFSLRGSSAALNAAMAACNG